MLNSPFVVQQAKHFVSRPEFNSQTTEAGRVRALYALAYQRDPILGKSPWRFNSSRPAIAELQRWRSDRVLSRVGCETGLSGSKELPEPLNAWEKYAQVLLMSNELVFVD